MYPKYRWGVEGDTPSFMYLMAPGLSNPDDPTQGNWGGYAEWLKTPDNTTYAYTNPQGTQAYDTCYKYVTYFYSPNFNNFAARMDWAKDGKGNRNPVVVLNGDSTFSVLTVKHMQGTTATIDATLSYDPDGNMLSFKGWWMPAAGTWKQPVSITNANSGKATITIPAGSAGKNFHLIYEVNDNGSPPLTSYRRIIIESTDQQTDVSNVSKKTSYTNVNNGFITVFDIKGRQLGQNKGHNKTTSSVLLHRDGCNRIRPFVVTGKN